MADKTISLPELMEFHPCDTPRGMEYYNLDILTRDQQERLNRHKTETIRDNQKYLFKNPEIRAVMHVILRKLLLERPIHDVENFIGKYFSENWQAITEDVKKYVKSLPKKPKPQERKVSMKEDKHVTLDEPRLESASDQFSKSSEESLTLYIVSEILEEIVDKVYEHSPKRVRTSEDMDVSDDAKISVKGSVDDDDELYFDLGLDFDLDFTAYHEEDDKE